MNDFERRLAALLNEQVDHELDLRKVGAANGERHIALPDAHTHRTGARRPRARWLPLIAAACVVAVVGGSYGVTQLLSSPAPADHSIVPGPPPSTSVERPAPSARVVPAPVTVTTSSAASPTTSHSSPSPHSSAASHTTPASRSSAPSHTVTRSQPPLRPTATALVVLRPVTAAGSAAPGYHVVSESTTVVCRGETSPVAVDSNVRFCGDSATYTDACWLAADRQHVLCLTDPFSRTLRRLTLSGGFADVAAPAHPVPQAIVLDDGRQFLIRDGGAWSNLAQHPSWMGFYFQRLVFHANIYGPLPGDGVDTASPRWTVVVFADSGQGAGVTHPVVTAYEFGTAR